METVIRESINPKKLKLVLLSILFVGIVSNSNAQSDYKKYKESIQMVFDLATAQETMQAFVISTEVDNQLTSQVVQKFNVEDVKKQEFKRINCKSCALLSEEVASMPISFIYKKIEENRVYLITRKEDKYLIQTFGDR